MCIHRRNMLDIGMHFSLGWKTYTGLTQVTLRISGYCTPYSSLTLIMTVKYFEKNGTATQ